MQCNTKQLQRGEHNQSNSYSELGRNIASSNCKHISTWEMQKLQCRMSKVQTNRVILQLGCHILSAAHEHRRWHLRASPTAIPPFPHNACPGASWQCPGIPRLSSKKKKKKNIVPNGNPQTIRTFVSAFHRTGWVH